MSTIFGFSASTAGSSNSSPAALLGDQVENLDPVVVVLTPCWTECASCRAGPLRGGTCTTAPRARFVGFAGSWPVDRPVSRSSYDGLMSEHVHGKAVLDEVTPLSRALRQAIPGVYKGYTALSSAAMASGALDAKTKELIALAIPPRCAATGASLPTPAALPSPARARDEAAEAIGVALVLSGGPGDRVRSSCL